MIYHAIQHEVQCASGREDTAERRDKNRAGRWQYDQTTALVFFYLLMCLSDLRNSAVWLSMELCTAYSLI
jgi:hypothetical protein